MNWAVCPLNRLPFFLSFFSSLPPIFSPLPPFSSLFASSDVLPSDFQSNCEHCTISFPSPFQKPLPVLGPSLSFFLFPISVPFHTPRHPLPPPAPLSAWAQFLRLRLSHCQNGGKAQSVTIPQALRLRTKCLLFFFSSELLLLFLSSKTISSIP